MPVPYSAVGIRRRARQLGAVYDNGLKQWAHPVEQSRRDVQRRVQV
ncbi:hypothetical protein ABR737_00520 [Streptomyces sp. Edi2]